MPTPRRRLGVRFPAVFREYLREMAKSPGDLFRGSHLAGITEFEQFRADATGVAGRDGPCTHPPARGSGVPVAPRVHVPVPARSWRVERAADAVDRDRTAAVRSPPGFAGMVDAEVRLMESNNARFREQGGLLPHAPPRGRIYSVASGSGER